MSGLQIHENAELSWDEFKSCIKSRDNNPHTWKFLSLPAILHLGKLDERGRELLYATSQDYLHRERSIDVKLGLNNELLIQKVSSATIGTFTEVRTKSNLTFDLKTLRAERIAGSIHTHPTLCSNVLSNPPSPIDVSNMFSPPPFAYQFMMVYTEGLALDDRQRHWMMQRTGETTNKTEVQKAIWISNMVSQLNHNVNGLYEENGGDFDVHSVQQQHLALLKACDHHKIGLYICSDDTDQFVRSDLYETL